MAIERLETHDLRFPLPGGAGSDSRHVDPVYSFATCILTDADGRSGTDPVSEHGTGFAFTIGRGNDLVCRAIECLEPLVLGADVREIVRDFGTYWSRWANESQLRWLGPHKGVIHLALAAVVGAVVDLWAKIEQKPLWRLLLDLTPDELVAMVDFSAIDDYLTPDEARELLATRRLADDEIEAQIRRGYPAYDTSVGWLGYGRDELLANCRASVDAGYRAVKLKVGGPDLAEDVARVAAVREALGDEILIMVDANQRWGVGDAIAAGRAFAPLAPFWFEEPVHPDDILGYARVAEALAPMRIAGGEHLANQVLFKNLIRAGGVGIVQPDAVRLGGLPEYLAVALMAAKAELPALPHVGDMGQLHQHLILFTRCALGMPELPLEMIPHIAEHFAEPVRVEDGRYVLPRTPGAGTSFTAESLSRYRCPGPATHTPRRQSSGAGRGKLDDSGLDC